MGGAAPCLLWHAALLSHAAPTTQTADLPSLPQELKGALDEAIASLARGPDLAAALWERLVAAVVVQPATAEAAAVPRYDLSYQLNEIEVGGGQNREETHMDWLYMAAGATGATAPG